MTMRDLLQEVEEKVDFVIDKATDVVDEICSDRNKKIIEDAATGFVDGITEVVKGAGKVIDEVFVAGIEGTESAVKAIGTFIEETFSTDPHSLNKGDLVARPLLDVKGFFYSHIGVYVGNGMVIHFSGTDENSSFSKVEKVALGDFARGQEIEVYAKAQSLDHSQNVCERAELICNNKLNEYNGRYNMVSLNCEDFATECFEVEFKGIRHSVPKLSQRTKTQATLMLARFGVKMLFRI